jgi:hypothetical protein
MNEGIDIIAVIWDGPYKIEDISAKNHDSWDYGVYQVYGTHNIYGPDTLLYIGKTQDTKFGERIPANQEWVNWDSSDVDIYLGRIAGIDQMTEDKWNEWDSKIDRAERLLIYYCSPPYNGENLQSYGDMQDTIVLNYKARKRLPVEVSTAYEEYAAQEQLRIYE